MQQVKLFGVAGEFEEDDAIPVPLFVNLFIEAQTGADDVAVEGKDLLQLCGVTQLGRDFNAYDSG